MAGLDVIVVAAGRSTRMRGIDKVFVPVAGTPLLAYSLDIFEGTPLVGRIALVVAEANLGAARKLVEDRHYGKVLAIVAGGERRQDSVRKGIEALPDAEWIAVHDGARPFLDHELLERGLKAAQAVGAAIAAVPVRDTIKSVGGDRVIRDTPPRESLWAAQTPQIFNRELLARAHRDITSDMTDDAAMVEALGHKVAVFEGSPLNIKVTTPEDLVIAEAIASSRVRGEAGRRYGTGFDGHKLAEGGPLRLGGIDVPFELHLEGHSDGDVLLHAIASSILGAAGLGDLGRHFPSTEPALKGIDSREILRRTKALAAGAGWMTDFDEATIFAQRPKLSPYL
ncbi:MAG: 2-C-methyl-D-erythritol 4-phosphate cytidylyltransferase [Chloroflexi bacterium]|nr:2-C-methyl-D-erythritol 4-phosphate cytidylyltransferase [Chloroflexota bacterium]